jgi:transcription termination factor NusB
VIINEAVNLAKKFSGEDSGDFVNGILDAASKARKTR